MTCLANPEPAGVEVEAYPNLVIASGNLVGFTRPLTPQAEALRRLLRATALNPPTDAPGPAVAAQVQAFADRLVSVITQFDGPRIEFGDGPQGDR